MTKKQQLLIHKCAPKGAERDFVQVYDHAILSNDNTEDI